MTKQFTAKQHLNRRLKLGIINIFDARTRMFNTTVLVLGYLLGLWVATPKYQDYHAPVAQAVKSQKAVALASIEAKPQTNKDVLVIDTTKPPVEGIVPTPTADVQYWDESIPDKDKEKAAKIRDWMTAAINLPDEKVEKAIVAAWGQKKLNPEFLLALALNHSQLEPTFDQGGRIGFMGLPKDKVVEKIKDVDVSKLSSDVEYNIEVALKYYDGCRKRAGGKLDLAIAKFDGNDEQNSTYVQAVKATTTKLKGL